MALSPLRPCLHPGCPELTRNGYCARHKPQHKRGVSADWHAWYSTKQWKRIAGEHLLAEPFCRECAKAGTRTRATVVDHIIPHRGNRQLFLDRSNLQSLCKHHHDQKTAEETRRDKSFFMQK